MDPVFDILIVGGGSAGCALAGRLAVTTELSIAVLEAGPSDDHWRVRTPLALISLMGDPVRDWRRESAPQTALGGRRVKAPRGRMIGGSGSLNSMVWLRGRADDYDGWGAPGWRWDDVRPAFEAIEAAIRPEPPPSPHPVSIAFADADGPSAGAPTPERAGLGVYRTNMRRGRRWSAADAFLRPALATGRVEVATGAEVARLVFDGGRATGVALRDGRRFSARAGVALTAGAFESPAILMRSGVGPAAHLRDLGIEVVVDAPGVGENLHDHPAVPLHHAGPGSGYGLSPELIPTAIAAPFRYAASGTGPLASNQVEAGGFLRADEGEGPPDVQFHFIPAKLGWKGRMIAAGRGYTADVCVSRPVSRGRLRLASADAAAAPEIDLGLLSDPRDRALMRRGVRLLRRLLDAPSFDARRAPEAFPGREVESDPELDAHLDARLGTSYHPVGTVAIGGPATADLRVAGTEGLWVADASVMPRITSANTNAPSMMIGRRGAEMVAAALAQHRRAA